jgi:hypothetical protein
MRAVAVLVSLFMLVSAVAGVNALEVNEGAHMVGELVGTPVGLLMFLCLPCILRVPLLFIFQPIIFDSLALFMNTLVKYLTVFSVTSFYDFVGSVSPADPDRIFSPASTVLSIVKGFFDGAWRPGRLSCWRICLSPAGKMVNGFIATTTMEDYEASRPLANRGVPSRTIEKVTEPENTEPQ